MLVGTWYHPIISSNSNQLRFQLASPSPPTITQAPEQKAKMVKEVNKARGQREEGKSHTVHRRLRPHSRNQAHTSSHEVRKYLIRCLITGAGIFPEARNFERRIAFMASAKGAIKRRGLGNFRCSSPALLRSRGHSR